MKVAIITEGGKNIGYGHISRCLSLYAEFKRKKISPLFVINHDRQLLSSLQISGLRSYAKGIDEILSLIKGFDCVVIDSYKLKKAEYLHIRRGIPLLVCLDDFNRIDYPADIIVNGAPYAPELGYPFPRNKLYLLGEKFFPLRKDFRPQKQKIIRERLSEILITFGGDDTRQMTKPIGNFILSNFSSVKLNIFSGISSRLKHRLIMDYSSARVRYHFQPTTTSMIKIMRQADIAISAGGQTLYELARIGTPTIGICIAENQRNNLRFLARHGFLKNCGWHNSRDLFKKVRHAIIEMRSLSQRKKMSLAGRRLLDGRGAERIVKKILDYNLN